VRLLETVDEAHVVAAFLRAELASERFAEPLRASLQQLAADERLVTEADVDDTTANELRRRVLAACRADSLGSRLDGLAWRRAALTRDEVLAIRYSAWDYWLEISDGTRLPAVAAVLFRGDGEDASWEEVETGATPLIAVRADANARIVVVEGHVRLTAYALFPERLPHELEILLGEAESLRDWDMY
jgi:hypothetical protein